MEIIVDTREQQPLFDKGCIKYKLLVGDYSTLELRKVFCIERKSLQDLYSTILSGHIRFRKEHIRALANNIQLVLYIEGSKEDFRLKNFPGGKYRECSGDTLIKIVDSISHRWPMEIHWCGSRNKCKRMIYERLQKEEAVLSATKAKASIESSK